jgi:hypothetical protein
MTIATQKFSPSVTAEKAPKAPLTLAAVIAAFFMVNLRESRAIVRSGVRGDV